MAKRKQRRVYTTRDRVLAVIARESTVYNKDTQSYERRSLTDAIKRSAKKLKVSTSTIKRWSEGAEPRTKTRKEKSRVQRLNRAATTARAATQKELAADKRRHRKALRIDPNDLPMLPPVHRRKLKEYKRDRKGNVHATGKTYESSIANYSVQGMRFKEVYALVRQAWKAGKPFQFVYEVPAGGSLPKSGRYGPRKVSKPTRAGTAPINPGDFDDETQLLNFLNRYIDFEEGLYSRRMLYVSIDDKEIEE